MDDDADDGGGFVVESGALILVATRNLALTAEYIKFAVARRAIGNFASGRASIQSESSILANTINVSKFGSPMIVDKVLQSASGIPAQRHASDIQVHVSVTVEEGAVSENKAISQNQQARQTEQVPA